MRVKLPIGKGDTTDEHENKWKDLYGHAPRGTITTEKQVL